MLNWFWKSILERIKAAAKKHDNECKLARGVISVQENYDWAMKTVQDKPIPPDPPPL